MSQESRTCQNCRTSFVVDAQDFAFYEKIQVPPPTFCPRCRLQRRLAWRNERAFYKRTCGLCRKDIIAMYPADVPFPVYCRECWYSDAWDPKNYGREYDFSRPFFAQFKELQNAVPRLNLQVDNCVNCDFANQIANCKNCYLISSGSGNEDSQYCFRILESKDATDCLIILRCESAYECVECLGSARIAFTQDCADSLDMLFCFDARSSQNCFMSANLRHASYIFRGERLSKAEYERRIKEIDTGSYKTLTALKKEFSLLKRGAVRRFANERHCVDSVGHTMSNAKDCFWCFNVADVEKCRYCLYVNEAKDCMDVNNGCCTMELMYECCTAGVDAARAFLSIDAWPQVLDITYCDACRNGSQDLFGCISLRKHRYCILNKQYTKEKYGALMPRIREHMDAMPYIDQKGRVYRYGEFLPVELSPFPYNNSAAHDHLQLTKEEAVAQGFSWAEPEAKHPSVTLGTDEIPDHIRDVKDSIVQEIIACEHRGGCEDKCTGAFRIIPQELRFYRQANIALPRLCPNCRHYERFRTRPPLWFWRGRCKCDPMVRKNSALHAHHPAGRCENTFETPYAPDRPEIVYCESCYNSEVI